MSSSPLSSALARAGLALGVACCLAACAAAPKTDEQREADRQMVERVQAALGSDKTLYSSHITVRADNGVVRLTGFVWDPPDLTEAQQVAELVPGVTKVVNNLELQLNGIDNSGVSR